MHKILFFTVAFLGLSAGRVAGQPFDVRQYGARGDGRQLETPFIQKAIDACHQSGGGRVVLPAGRYLSGTLILRSNVEFHLSAGAVLLGSTRLEDYQQQHPHLLYAPGVENVALTGYGTIDGQGEFFFDKSSASWRDLERPRPWIVFEKSRQLKVENVRLIYSPAHVLDFTGCDNVMVNGVTIYNDMRSPNTDGIDIRNTRNVQISNCNIWTGDDAICLKSGRDTVQNIVVTNCILASDDSAIKFGTGSAIATRNCIFSNITIHHTRYGIALFMLDGGLFEHCLFENIIIETASRHQTEYPVFIDIDKRTPERSLGRVRDLSFRDLKITTRGNILVAGQASNLLEDLDFENISITIRGLSDLSRISRKPSGNKEIKKDGALDDFARIPAHLVFGNIRNLQVRNLRIRHDEVSGEPDRHALYFINAGKVTIDGFSGRPAKESSNLAAIHALRSFDFVLRDVQTDPGLKLLSTQDSSVESFQER